MIKWGLSGLAVLLVAFVMTPVAKVDKRIGDEAPASVWRDDVRPEKSGLRVAIEGRLAWLGLL